LKWIGQHIVDLIARFRNDVYLENISGHGSDPDRFLTMHSSTGKVTYRTGAEVLSDLNGVDADKTVSSVSFIPDVATSYASWAASSGGKASIFRIMGGEGIDTTANDQVNQDPSSGGFPIITISGEDASTSNKGVASFSSDNFSVSSGAVTIKSGGVDLTNEVTGALPTANIADDAVTFAKASGVTPNVYGNTIKILPTDFMVNDDVLTEPLTFKDGTNSGVAISNTASEMIAFVAIPEGMKATALDIYSTNAKVVKVYELDVNDTTNFNTATSVDGNANTQISLDIDSTATNYLAILYVATATGNRIWGGLLTIAPI